MPDEHMRDAMQALHDAEKMQSVAALQEAQVHATLHLAEQVKQIAEILRKADGQ